MKKFLYFIFICTLCVGFTACGGDDDDPKEEEFVWNGDWNDPNDRNYKPEGYNPIQGVWQRDDDPERGFYFSEDCVECDVTFFDNGTYVIASNPIFCAKYIINNTAFRYTSAIELTYKWEIEDNTLRTMSIGGTGWVYYTRINE